MPARLSHLAWVVLSILLILEAPTADACTTFCLKTQGQTVFGKNYDWHFADGHLMVNKANMERRSKISDLTWTSRYGSVTFNQYGRNSPSGGINERGVVVELMWMDSTGYPGVDERLAIGNLEWIQYQLDTADTVEDIIASDAKIRILHTDEPLHYLAADARGGVATIEFLDGALVVHRGGDLPVSALTNDTYADALGFWQQQGTHPSKPTQRAQADLEAPHLSGNGSLERFARAALWTRPKTQPKDAVAYAFEALSDLAQGSSTQWSIVYELEARRVHFKIQRGAAVAHLDLADLDFSCEQAVQTVDLLHGTAGDLAPRLRDYSIDLNRDILVTAFGHPPNRRVLPKSELDWRARHPSGDLCLPTL